MIAAAKVTPGGETGMHVDSWRVICGQILFGGSSVVKFYLNSAGFAT